MIIIVQGPPASGKTTLAKAISAKFSLPVVARDQIQEWLSSVDIEQDNKIQSFCGQAGYELMFDLAGELAKGSGSFVVEGCMNPEGGPRHMLDKLGQHNHTIVEVFVTAHVDVLVDRYLGRAGTESRHEAHGNESARGDELAKHLKECNYRPMAIGKLILEYDNSENPEAIKLEILRTLESHLVEPGIQTR